MGSSKYAAALFVVLAGACGATERSSGDARGGGASGGVAWGANAGGSAGNLPLGGAGADTAPSDAVGGVVGAKGGRAGDGGDGGVGGCSSQRPAFEPRCDEPTFTMGTSTCGEALTREVLQCGMPGSQFDSRCCYRAVCDDDADCGGGRCLPLLTQAPSFPVGSLFESCELACDECYCTVTADYNLKSYCVVSRIEEFDCDVRGRSCDTLRAWAENFGPVGAAGAAGAAGADFPFLEGVSSHFLQQVQLCAARITAARATDCGD